MRLQMTFFTRLAAVYTLIGASGVAYAAQSSPSAQRWDLQMIEEAPIWEYLRVDYFYADRERFWPERKSALQTVINEFPNSRWADDAAVLLAGGQASIEKDIPGAIAALRKVMERYPSEATVVTHWDTESGCQLGGDWMMWVGGLAYLNPDRSIRTSKPFDRNGKIGYQEREALVYFEHLEQYPRLTQDIAQFVIAEMLVQQGDEAGAVAELEALIARCPDLGTMNAMDREAAGGADGFLIAHAPDSEIAPLWRPQYEAYLWLMYSYQYHGEQDKAMDTGLKLVSKCSSDGWYLRMNRGVGDVYAENKRWAEAKQQYQLAVQGVHGFVVDQAARWERADDETGEIWKPPDFVSWERQVWKAYEQSWVPYQLAELEGLVLAMSLLLEPTAVDHEISAAEVPQAFTLKQNWPNPFNSSTVISYIIPRSAPVRLNVYDSRGQQVGTLVEGDEAAGRHQVHWNGRDQDGRPVASGVYAYRLQAGGFEAVRRMILVR